MNLKRALLTTTSITTLCFGLSHADRKLSSGKGYELGLGGTLEAQMGSRYQTTPHLPPMSPNNKYVGFDTAASMHGSVKLFNDNGWTYGAQLGLKMATINEDPAGSHYLDRTYMFIENPNVLRLEIGTNVSAANAMKLGAGSVAVATGGVNGSWTKFVSVDSYTSDDFSPGAFAGSPAKNAKIVDADDFIKSPKLVLKEGDLEDGSHERYRKITVYVPINDFKIGVSYGPDGANVGSKAFIPYNFAAATAEEKVRSKNPTSVSLNWKKSFNKDRELALSVVGEYAQYNPKKDEVGTFNNYKALTVGGVYKCGKMSFGGSYGNHFKSKFRALTGVKDSYLFSAGAAYNFGKAAASLSYLYSDLNTNILNVVSAGVDYKVRENFVSYLEATYFNADQKNHFDGSAITPRVAKNSGTALILGARVTF